MSSRTLQAMSAKALLSFLGLLLASSHTFGFELGIVPDQRPLSRFTHGVTLVIQNNSFNQVRRAFIQDGNVYRSVTNLAPRRNYCEGFVQRSAPILTDIPTRLHFLPNNEVKLFNTFAGFSLTCFKRASDGMWVVEDVKEAFGSLIVLTAEEAK